jgi:peptidoglycan/LPS O-acetylase OafA/YrhL|nr:acyltransferase [Neorhizobium tomejilense]
MIVKNSTHRLPVLDLMRFAAALGVLFFHFLYAGAEEGVYPGIAPMSAFSLGWLGVDVFFVISGLVIAISTEGRTAVSFAKARFIRLFPAFFVCSALGALAWGLFSTHKIDLLVQWIVGLTFVPGAFGFEPRLSVYWTLAIEVTFYLWVAVFITTGVWRYLNVIMVSWLALALVNQFLFQNSSVSAIFLTNFAGHFCAGMAIYQIVRGRATAVTPIILAAAWLCFYKYNLGYFNYMAAAHGFVVDQRFVPFIPLLVILSVYAAADVATVGPSVARWFSVLGAASYPLYLVHTDVGHGGRMYFDRLAGRFPSISDIITPSVHMGIAIIGSVTASVLFAVYVEPRARSLLKRVVR